MSLARKLYSLYAAPSIWQLFGDDRVLITYEFENVTKNCRGLVSDVRQQWVQSETGMLEKRTFCQLKISPDEFSVMGGVDDPQLKGIFIITDGCNNATRWSVASLEGDAIVARTDSFVVINLMQTRAAARSSRTLRQ